MTNDGLILSTRWGSTPLRKSANFIKILLFVCVHLLVSVGMLSCVRIVAPRQCCLKHDTALKLYTAGDVKLFRRLIILITCQKVDGVKIERLLMDTLSFESIGCQEQLSSFCLALTIMVQRCEKLYENYTIVVIFYVRAVQSMGITSRTGMRLSNFLHHTVHDLRQTSLYLVSNLA